jgi:uroporphyrin-III C-methyltransferase
VLLARLQGLVVLDGADELIETAPAVVARLVTSLLADLAGLVAREAIASPALIIVGDVAALPAARAKAKETACLVC